MSLIYSSLYLVTNILAPIFAMVYFEVRCQIDWNNNELDLTRKEPGNPQPNKAEKNYIKVHYGKWAMLILSILVFNLFPENIYFILLGLVIKATVIMSPQSLNNIVEEIIQKLHLEIYSKLLVKWLIEIYLNIIENMNIYIVINKIQEKEEKIEVLNRLKDSFSRIQIQLQDNEQLKKKSFIIAAKKLQNTSKNIKSYENIGVNCDILKSSEVGKELLKILQEKTLLKQKQKSLVTSIPRIQEPTNDIQNELKRARTEIYQFQSQSLKQKIKKTKQGVNIPTSEKKPLQNQPDIEESRFMIKRSQTFDIEEFQFEDSPVSNKKTNNNLSYYPIKTQRSMTKKVGFSQSITMNEQNMGSFQKIKSKKRYLDEDTGNMDKILQDLEAKEKVEANESKELDLQSNPQILPVGSSFSSNVQKPIHLFKMNLSSLGQSSNNKISPSLISISQQETILSSRKNLILKSKKEIVMEELSEEFLIPNKIQASISESEYSDMFESEEQDKEPKLEIKVQAVVQSSNVPKGLKPRQDICKIQLYDNKDIKFYSIYDHLIFSGKILQLFKKPENFYELICEQTKKIEDGKQVQNNGQKTKQVKKVKFRGQAKPFMKYLSVNK